MNQRNLDGNSIIIRLEMTTKDIKFGEVASVISEAGGDIIAIDVDFHQSGCKRARLDGRSYRCTR